MGVFSFLQGMGQAAVDAASRLVGRPQLLGEVGPRHEELAPLEAMYKGRQYEGRGLAPSWDKLAPGERPPPFRQQRPSVQYDLPRYMVLRVAALLFGEGRFPEASFQPHAAGANVAPVNAWLAQVMDEGRLQLAALAAARNGLAVGSVAMTWAVVGGRFIFEAHKGQFCKPTFDQMDRRRLVRLEKRYVFTRKEPGPSGALVERSYVWREDWDASRHVVYEPKPTASRSEEWTVMAEAAHGFGVVPAVWIRALDESDHCDDGPSLYEGLGDLFEDIDRTISQKSRAIYFNQEPPRVVIGEDQEDRYRGRPAQHIGPGHVLRLPLQGAAHLLEMKGEGQRIAEEHVQAQRNRALEVARVVSHDPDKLVAAARSGAALRILHAPMLELVGELRQTFGAGLVELLNQILELARAGRLQALGALSLPPPTDLPAGRIALLWGDYFEPTEQEVNLAAQTVGALLDKRLIDRETAIRYMATYIGVRNVEHLMARIESEEEEPIPQRPSATAQDTGELVPEMEPGKD
jgi:hypothetical protein